MAIKAILQNIDGKKEDEVVDSNYSLASIWPVADHLFPLLQYIDPYGNTVFNGAQMPEVQRELELLIDKTSNVEQRDVLCRVLELAARCQRHPHMFLRFRGD